MSADDAAKWVRIGAGDPLRAAPTRQTPLRIARPIATLPFEDMEWEDFEKLVTDVLIDVHRLRDPRRYGRSGQAQQGLDVIASRADGTHVAVQCKKHKRFSATTLTTAVNAMRNADRPFEVSELIIATSASIDDTKVEQNLLRQRARTYPSDLQLWGPTQLSQQLRDQPRLVIRYFGPEAATAFCDSWTMLGPIPVPQVEAAQIRLALAETPEVTTGARALIDAAASRPAAQALPLIEQAQESLVTGGFPSHAANYNHLRDRHLVDLGRGTEAARDAMRDFWHRVNSGTEGAIKRAATRVRGLTDTLPENDAGALRTLVNQAVNLTTRARSTLPDDVSTLAGDDTDRAQLLVLAGESALANDDNAWLANAAPELRRLAKTSYNDPLLAVRLDILAAEGSDDWNDLLGRARRLRLAGGYDVSALVLARRARRAAWQNQFRLADAAWDEAVGYASLSARWSDAAAWTFARRSLNLLWAVSKVNELLPQQIALQDLGPTARILGDHADAHASALDALRTGDHAAAVEHAYVALRDAARAGEWNAEKAARIVLADAYAGEEQRDLAAHYYATAAMSQGEKVIAAGPDVFVDVLPDTRSPSYWTAGEAFRTLAAEADLIPDDKVQSVLAAIWAAIETTESGAFDLRGMRSSRIGGALAALSSIASMLPERDAAAALAYFAKQAPVADGFYRHHDADEAAIVASIATTHPALAIQALTHLIPLLSRSPQARTARTRAALEALADVARPLLDARMQAGDVWAGDQLAVDPNAEIERKLIDAAYARLTEPAVYTPGVMTVGNRAVEDAAIALHAVDDRLPAVLGEMLDRCRDPRASWFDRNAYLLAAMQVAERLDACDRRQHFTTAFALAVEPPAPDAGDANGSVAASFIDDRSGVSRQRAVYLCAILATDDEQKRTVRRVALALLRGGEESDEWATRALAELGDVTSDAVSFLAGMGSFARGYAARKWVELVVAAKTHTEVSPVGLRLAKDREAFVRRSFADAIAEFPRHPSLREVRDVLVADPRRSVRRRFA